MMVIFAILTKFFKTPFWFLNLNESVFEHFSSCFYRIYSGVYPHYLESVLLSFWIHINYF
jgi:hypothetical protein